MISYTIQYERIEERPGAGRLGRHILRDSRSAAYPYHRVGATITDVTWARHVGILDQGDTGSCTGNFMVGALATDPLFGALPAGHPALDETLALKIYSQAETIDGDGPYPPNDNGSTGPSVAKAAKTDGFISGYTWAQDENDALDALMIGPVGFGVNWYDSFDTPNAEGIVSLPKTARIRGGHEIVCRQVDVARQLFWCDNSWGTGWGVAGRFAVPYAVMARLLSEDGDCTSPVPLSAPAPTPVPTPTPPTPTPVPDVHVDSADATLSAAIPAGFLTGHHTRQIKVVAHALAAWEQAKGIQA